MIPSLGLGCFYWHPSYGSNQATLRNSRLERRKQQREYLILLMGHDSVSRGLFTGASPDIRGLELHLKDDPYGPNYTCFNTVE